MLVPAAGGHTLGQVALPDGAARSTSPGPRWPSTRRRRSSPCPTSAQASPTTGTRWTALGLALTSADLVGTMRGPCSSPPTTPRNAGSTARRSARSRPSSTCWPTPSSPRRSASSPSRSPGGRRPPAGDALAQAAVAQGVRRQAARTVCETRHPGARRHRQHLGVPGPRARRRALLSSDVLGGTGTNLARLLDHHGIPEGARGLR